MSASKGVLPYVQLPANYSGKIVKKDLRQHFAGEIR